MGSADFWMVVDLSNKDFGVIDKIFEENSLFKDFIPHFYHEEKKNIHISCYKGSFFPLTNILYDFFKQVNEKNSIVSISSRGEIREFDFADELDFFCWMYRTWKDSLDYFFEFCGAFLSCPHHYYGPKGFSYFFRKKYLVRYRDNKRCK